MGAGIWAHSTGHPGFAELQPATWYRERSERREHQARSVANLATVIACVEGDGALAGAG